MASTLLKLNKMCLYVIGNKEILKTSARRVLYCMKL